MNTEWNTLVQLILATNRFGNSRCDEFKERLSSLLPSAFEITTNPWWGGKSYGIASRYNAMFIMELMDDDFSTAVRNAVTEYVATISYPTETNPFGVQWTTGSGWGGSPTIIGFGQSLGIMYRFFPEIEELKTYTLRAADYILGRHPVTNNSWLSGVGTKSHLHPYNSNRADESFIPGSILPGHITVSPDIVESLDDFSFLWFENESIINYQSKWISVGLAASMIANESAVEPLAAVEQAPTKDFTNDFMMNIKKTDSTDGYLQTQGFNLFMNNNSSDTELGESKNTGIELVQSGRRIAANGDISLVTAPEQWDNVIAPVCNSRIVDDAANTISASMTIPADSKGSPAVNYSLKAEPETGGVKVTVKLDVPLPADLTGKAGFSLQFAPSQFISKSFQTDSDGDGNYDTFGVFPLVPQDDMVSQDRARTENQPWYVKNWYDDEGNMQPLPLASGKKMTFAAEDSENRIRITSDNGELSLYDGRNNDQDGWFILRTMIPADTTEIVWHISPDVKQDWTREPNVAFNQAGYTPDISKVAVIELDPNFDAPATAFIDRLNADGTYTEVFSGEISTVPTIWKRYYYRNFDFTAVSEPGIYVIRYAGERSEPFKIADNAYSRLWQSSLSGFLAVHMDHMKVREGYRIWHKQTFADDALQAPLNTQWFDGWSTGSATDSEYAAYEHIPGLATGGWYDPSDYDLDTATNLEVIQDLALAFKEFGVAYDTLTVNTTAGAVELHRKDGYNDVQQQVKQGILQILAQIDSVGFVFKGMKVPTLTQYSQSGDASKVSDGLVYNSSFSLGTTYGLMSGKLDDRIAFVGVKDTILQFKAASALASAAYVLKGFDDALAVRCLEAAEKIWSNETIATGGTQAEAQISAQWEAAVQMLIATDGSRDNCKQLIKDTASIELNTEHFGENGWKAVRILKYMDQDFRTEFMDALTQYIPVLDDQISASPFGVPLIDGNAGVLNMGISMSVLHKYYPDVVSSRYTLSAVNYILGTHMYNNTSWVSGVGTSSVTLCYGSNRADRSYIAGGVVAGAINVLSDFPEAVDDYAFLREETGYSIDTAAKWIIVGYAADTIASEAPYVPAVPQTTITGNDSAQPGSSFILGIGLNNIKQEEAIYAEDITLSYDSNVFEYVSTAGVNDKIQIAKEDSSVPGKVRIIAANIGGVSGESTNVLNLSFRVKAEASNTTGTIAVTKAKLGIAPEGTVIEPGLSSKMIAIGTAGEVDKTQLNEAIDSAERIFANAVVGSQPGQYPQTAKNTFRIAIDKAIALRDNADATQAQVDSEVIALNTAVQVFRSSVITDPGVSKGALAEAISNAEELFDNAEVGSQHGQYPQEAKLSFENAINDAKSVYNDPNTSQAQVDNAVTALKDAIETFKAAEISADIDKDGTINVGDLAIVAYYYGSNSQSPNWDKAKVADVNRDNKIDVTDLASVAIKILE